VQPQVDEVGITKNFPNSFRETGLHAQLQKQEIKNVVICGAMSHMCIDTTTRAAFDLGYQSIVISDACASDTSACSLHGWFARVICRGDFFRCMAYPIMHTICSSL
jgi:nicotinamidase-related amidase